MTFWPLAFTIRDRTEVGHRWEKVFEDQNDEAGLAVLEVGGGRKEALRAGRTAWRQEHEGCQSCYSPGHWMRPSDVWTTARALREPAAGTWTWCRAWTREAMPQVLLSAGAIQLEEQTEEAPPPPPPPPSWGIRRRRLPPAARGKAALAPPLGGTPGRWSSTSSRVAPDGASPRLRSWRPGGRQAA